MTAEVKSSRCQRAICYLWAFLILFFLPEISSLTLFALSALATCCLWNISNVLLAQNTYTCCSLCLGNSSPAAHRDSSLYHLTPISSEMHPGTSYGKFFYLLPVPLSLNQGSWPSHGLLSCNIENYILNCPIGRYTH